MSDRIPCINPVCRRTAPRSRHPYASEIICGKCWKLLPRRLTVRYKALRKRERGIIKLINKRISKKSITGSEVCRLENMIWRQLNQNWSEIKAYFTNKPEPEGLSRFLQENGL